MRFIIFYYLPSVLGVAVYTALPDLRMCESLLVPERGPGTKEIVPDRFLSLKKSPGQPLSLPEKLCLEKAGVSL